MVRKDKHDDRNPTIRGASRKSEMDLKKKLHKRSGGRPARLKALLAEDAAAELAAIEARVAAEAEAKAKEASEKEVAEKPKPKRKSRAKKKTE